MAPSNKLLRNGTVISYNEKTSSLETLLHASILIKDGNIASITTEPSFENSVPADTEIIDVTGKIVCSGFIDTHRHSWMTAYRTLSPNITLASYFTWISYLSPGARDPFSPEDIYDSTLAGLYEAVNAGVTTIVEHAQNNWSPEIMQRGFDASVDSGVRMLWCYTPYPHDHFSADRQIQVWKEMSEKHRCKPSTVTMGLAWDSIGFDNDSAVCDKKKLVKDLELEAITTHCMVGPWGTDHANSVENADKHGLLDMNVPVIFSHAGHITDDGKALLREKNHFISVTPESEMHFGHGQSTCFDIQDQTSLGLDTPSLFSGDVLTQSRLWLATNRTIRYNATLARGLIPRQNPMDVKEAFLLATRQGGLALRRKDLGVLTAGAKADIVVFDGDSPHMCGWQDPVAAVILHANTGDIRHVLVDGEFRKRDGKLVMIEPWEQLSARFKNLAARVQEANKNPPEMWDTVWGKAYGDVEIASTSRE